jgi:hypothetical protein
VTYILRVVGDLAVRADGGMLPDTVGDIAR